MMPATVLAVGTLSLAALTAAAGSLLGKPGHLLRGATTGGLWGLVLFGGFFVATLAAMRLDRLKASASSGGPPAFSAPIPDSAAPDSR